MPYAGTLVPGVYVTRMIGLLLATLAGIATVAAVASEDPHGAGLARFAYVNTSVFQTSFGTLVPKRPLEPALAETAESKDADFRPVLLVAAEAITSDPIELAEGTRAVATDGVGTVSLVGDVDSTAPAAQDPPQQLASLEPSALFQLSAAPVQETAPQLAALEEPASLADATPLVPVKVQEAAPEIVQDTAQQNTALMPSAIAPGSLPIVREAPQMIAAVEPTPVVSGRAPDEILASRLERPVHAPPILKRTRHQHAAHATAHKRAHIAKKKIATTTVPKWATKMFEGPWQQHAFAYQ
jgi:hypothetical protein